MIQQSPKPENLQDRKIIHAAVVGFGLSGKVFHAPLLRAHKGFHIGAFVSNNTLVHEQYPDAKLYTRFEEVLNDPQIDLVVICTPHQLHLSQTVESLRAGKHVVVEKPVALSSADFKIMMETAKKTQRLLIPFHNRRWDGDFLTIRHLIASGSLGQLVDFESRFDRYSPIVSRAEWRYLGSDAGGTLYDLGPHLIDQAIVLFGKPKAVYANLRFLRQKSQSNDGFDLTLFYDKLVVTLKAGVYVKEAGPRFQLHGTLGSFLKYGLDPQEGRLKEKASSSLKGIGRDKKQDFGILNCVVDGETSRRKFPTIPGNYLGFYDNVFDAIVRGAPQDVKMEEALMVLEIIEAAIKSYNTGKNIDL